MSISVRKFLSFKFDAEMLPGLLELASLVHSGLTRTVGLGVSCNWSEEESILHLGIYVWSDGIAFEI